MKNLFHHLLLIILIVSCRQDSQEMSTGLLWSIKAKNGKESYIFGTIHLYPKDELTISERAVSKLRYCKTLALERDINNEEQQKLFIDSIKPHSILDTYGIIYTHYNPQLENMEGGLLRIAKENNLSVTGLESANEVLSIINNIPSQNKIREKQETLNLYKKAIQLYKGESIGAFADIYLDQEFGKVLRKLLVDQRNKNWIDDIESLIEKDETFIAVGMGHLGGEKGILNLLKTKGYNLKRVDKQN